MNTNKQKIALRLAPLLLLWPAVAGCAPTQPAAAANNAVPAPAVAPAESKPAAVNSPSLNSAEALTAIQASLENLYTQVNPSVVSIQVTNKTTASAMPQLNLPDLPFFFGNPFGNGNGQSPQQQQPQEFYQHGAGSGFVWDTAGHIITNNHVVDGADKITVTFVDETTVPAEVVGADRDSDLAVLKVDLPADQLQPIALADSTQVKVGQLAVAVGNPFGLENTMTVGFVSALGRYLPVSAGAEQGLASQGPSFTIPDIIQTDAPINPGNSGGVLVNDQGQVIGVTAAIESPVRASAGVGFAIPSAIVDKVVPALIKDGHFDHAWLGLSGISLNPELAAAMNLESGQHGALVIAVTPNGPADTAGVHGSDRQIKIEDQQVKVGGDVIVAMDGQPVTGFDDVVSYLARATEVGQKVELTVLRDGQEKTLTTTLAARPAPNTQPEQAENSPTERPRLGIEGTTVTPEIAQAMGLSADQQGVLVQQIEVGSPADQADLNGSYKSVTINSQLMPVGGDIITAIDGQPVTSIADLQAFLAQAETGQKITLTILRAGQSMDVPVTLN